MKGIKILIRLSLCFLILFAITGCEKDHLLVENQNAPDAARTLGSAEDLMALVAGAYMEIYGAMQKNYPGMALSTAGDEITSSWGNWHMRNASWEPRFAYDNSPSYGYRGFNETPWYNCYAGISSANDGLRAIAGDPQFFGDDTPMAHAFAKWVQGLCHCFLGFFFDQAFIFDESVNLETDVLEFSPYGDVMDAGIAMLEECITLCNANDFTLPDTWMNGLACTNEYLAQLCHSYIARYLAWEGRRPADRVAADWNAIMNHAQQGITENFILTGDGNYWWCRLQGHTQHPVWCRADNNALGPADTSGNYQAWLATPLEERMHFLIHTADRRITGPDSAQQDGKYFSYEGTPNHPADRGTYHFSAYMLHRYPHWDLGYTGDMYLFTTNELDLLVAEGLLHTGGDAATIAELINRTRVTNGELPPATAADPVGTINDAHFSNTLWGMYKHEMFIENFCVTAGTGYASRRGWGELIPGTPLHWPVPGKELEILLLENYTHGGTRGDHAKRLPDVLYPQTH